MNFVGRLAQRLERSVYTRKVVRSNRTVPTIFTPFPGFLDCFASASPPRPACKPTGHLKFENVRNGTVGQVFLGWGRSSICNRHVMNRPYCGSVAGTVYPSLCLRVVDSKWLFLGPVQE